MKGPTDGATTEAVPEESDAEMSGAESERTVSTQDAPDTSEEEADSSDSSEMDENYCEIRRTECMDDLVDLERQFVFLREMLYTERMKQIEDGLVAIRSGKSEEYLGPLQKLQENMHMRTEVAGILRQLRLNNIKNTFEAEEQAARQNLESEKQLAWDWIHDDLMEKIRRLEEDRHNVELSWGEGGEWGSRSRSRPRRKAVTVSGPYIVYMLSQQEILEDWAVIKKSLKRSP